jgi:hypothetical protein
LDCVDAAASRVRRRKVPELRILPTDLEEIAMNRNINDRRCPELASGFKLAAAVVVIGLIVAASESPINWVPTATVHDVAAGETAPAASEHFPSDYAPNGEPTPHIEAF